MELRTEHTKIGLTLAKPSPTSKLKYINVYWTHPNWTELGKTISNIQTEICNSLSNGVLNAPKLGWTWQSPRQHPAIFMSTFDGFLTCFVLSGFLVFGELDRSLWLRGKFFYTVLGSCPSLERHYCGCGGFFRFFLLLPADKECECPHAGTVIKIAAFSNHHHQPNHHHTFFFLFIFHFFHFFLHFLLLY